MMHALLQLWNSEKGRSNIKQQTMGYPLLPHANLLLCTMTGYNKNSRKMFVAT